MLHEIGSPTLGAAQHTPWAAQKHYAVNSKESFTSSGEQGLSMKTSKRNPVSQGHQKDSQMVALKCTYRFLAAHSADYFPRPLSLG